MKTKKKHDRNYKTENLTGFKALKSLTLEKKYRKIPKISPEAGGGGGGGYIFQRPFLRGLFSEGLIYGGKFAFQNRLGWPYS